MPSFQMYFIFTLSNLNRAENIITVEKIVIIIIIVNNCYVILFPAVCLDTIYLLVPLFKVSGLCVLQHFDRQILYNF